MPLDPIFQFTIDSDIYVGKCLILLISPVNVMLQLNNAPTNYLLFFKMMDVIKDNLDDKRIPFRNICQMDGRYAYTMITKYKL
jgi:hypothetical protein